jgi:VWFA-related protein
MHRPPILLQQESEIRNVEKNESYSRKLAPGNERISNLVFDIVVRGRHYNPHRSYIHVPRRRGTGALFAWLALGLFITRALAFQAQSASPGRPPDDHTPRLIPRTSAEREQRFLTQHRIILNVHVADAAGMLSRDLGQADFTIYDNDQPRNLVSFRSVEGSAAQAHVIVVLDAVNSFTKRFRYSVKEFEKYLQDGNEPLPISVSIGVFSEAHIDLGPSSRDREALLADLRSRTSNLRATGCLSVPEHAEKIGVPALMPGAGAHATSSAMLRCLNERFVSSVNAVSFLAKEQVDIPGRAIVIWLGPGWPLLTNHEFSPDPPELKQNFFDQLVGVSTELREGQVTLDAVASPDQSDPNTGNARDFDFFDGVAKGDQARAGNLGLHALAHQTGGIILTDERDVAGQLKQCVADAESYYVLTFDTPAAPAFGEYHALDVKVDKPGLNVRTNTLYYAEQ